MYGRRWCVGQNSSWGFLRPGKKCSLQCYSDSSHHPDVPALMFLTATEPGHFRIHSHSCCFSPAQLTPCETPARAGLTSQVRFKFIVRPRRSKGFSLSSLPCNPEASSQLDSALNLPLKKESIPSLEMILPEELVLVRDPTGPDDTSGEFSAVTVVKVIV